MQDTRRSFLTLLASVMTLAIPGSGGLAAQSMGKPQGGGGSQASEPRPTMDDPEGGPVKPSTKAMLESNEKDIKKNIEKLFQLASDLKAEVEKTDSSQVLSLAMLRKAEEIEKLAHDIKARAKG